MTDRPLRRYGQWAGNRQGQPENVTRCIASVSVPRGVPHQCERKRGYGTDGLYCAIHNPDKVNARAQKAQEKYEAESRKRHIEWFGPALLAMLEKVLPDYEMYFRVVGLWAIEDAGYKNDAERLNRTLLEAKELIAKAKGE